MKSPANSTRNSPTANTERYVVRAGRPGPCWFACWSPGRLAAGAVAVMNAIVRAARFGQYSFVQDESWWAMALRIHVGNEDLTTSRFALSPLFELTSALRLLAAAPHQRDVPVLRPWLVRARDRYQALAREADLGVIGALNLPGWGADFLAPVPASVDTTIGDLLGQVRSTPADQAQREVAEALRRQPRVDPRVERILTSDRVAGYAADVLAAAWQALLEPEWRTLRAILERDVVYRAGQLASKGWAAALTGLHEALSWRQGRIELSRWPTDEDAELDGRGLLFIPSVFVWPALALSLDPPWPPALIYPARGVSALWEQPGRTGPGDRTAPAPRHLARRHPARAGGSGQHHPARRRAGPVARRHRRPPGRAARGRADNQGQIRAFGALPPHPGRRRADRRRA